MDDFTTTETVSIFGKIKNAFAGTIIGLILFIGAFVLLWWNEGNSVRIAKMNDFVRKNVVSVDSAQINPAYHNKLVYTNGSATSNETLNDGLISVPNAVGLIRNVQMYQWQESSHSDTHKNMGGSSSTTTTYSYSQEWSPTLIDSNNFKQGGHQNPASFPIEPSETYAKNVSLGAFTLTQDIVAKIKANSTINNLPNNPNYTVMQGYYYLGKNPAAPQIGDCKISYTYIPSGTKVSIIGGQYNNYLVNYVTPEGQFINVTTGISSAEEIMKNLDTRNMLITMGLRLLGIIMLWIGLNLLFAPLTILADVLPLLGDIVGAIQGMVLGLVALLLGLITISLAWLAYRPLIAVPALIGLCYAIYMIIQKRSQKQ